MSPFKVVLFDRNAEVVPDWVSQTFTDAGINFVAHKCQTQAEIIQYAGDAEVLWNWGSHTLKADGLAALPKCVGLIRTGSGTDNVPVDEATRRGIVVANTPEAHNDAVSDHAIGLLFAVTRHLITYDRAVRAGQWDPVRHNPDWHLHGRTLGLVAFGLIGRLVAKKLRGFDLNLLAYDPYVSADMMARESVRSVGLDELLSTSDFVFLHCPLTKDTYHLIGERELRLMKPTAILINTARGPVVDEPALVRALTEGWIAAAGLDVVEQEPAAPDNPLFKLENTVITPHTAGQSDEDVGLCWRLSMEAALAFAQGRWPHSYVNRSVQPRLKLA